MRSVPKRPEKILKSPKNRTWSGRSRVGEVTENFYSEALAFSSVAGRVDGTAGRGPYQATKFAVDGFTSVLATETTSFGIRCLTVEPGGFATDWAAASDGDSRHPSRIRRHVGRYRPSLEERCGQERRSRARWRNSRPRCHMRTSPHAPASWCRRSPPRLDLFPPPHREDEVWRKVSLSADFGQGYRVDLPGDGPAGSS
jgi:hypothetical protein